MNSVTSVLVRYWGVVFGTLLFDRALVAATTCAPRMLPGILDAVHCRLIDLLGEVESCLDTTVLTLTMERDSSWAVLKGISARGPPAVAALRVGLRLRARRLPPARRLRARAGRCGLRRGVLKSRR